MQCVSVGLRLGLGACDLRCVRCNVLYSVAACCSALVANFDVVGVGVICAACVAIFCSVLQCACGGIQRCSASDLCRVCCNVHVLQRVAVCCSMLQCVAGRCSALVAEIDGAVRVICTMCVALLCLWQNCRAVLQSDAESKRASERARPLQKMALDTLTVLDLQCKEGKGGPYMRCL